MYLHILHCSEQYMASAWCMGALHFLQVPTWVVAGALFSLPVDTRSSLGRM